MILLIASIVDQVTLSAAIDGSSTKLVVENRIAELLTLLYVFDSKEEKQICCICVITFIMRSLGGRCINTHIPELTVST